MTLTEQWKKGELERGRYYIKYRGNYMSDNWHGDCWEDSWSEYVEEVLAPVPSYDDWVYLHKARNDAHEIVESLTQENQQLKELLLVCREMLEEYQYYEGDFRIGDNAEISTSLLLKMIDNAIGEKK